MDDNFEKDLKDGLTDTEAQVIWYLRKNHNNSAVARLSKALKQLYDTNCDGIIRVEAKFSLTPEEIKFLESIRGISDDKLQNIKNYMQKLLEEV